jgi:tetratricopeptide (TPR) repeat protein
LGRNPKLYVAHYRLGTIAEVLGKPKKADMHYRKAIMLNARFIRPFVRLGLLYLNYDYPALALQVMKTAVAINADSGEAYNALGVAHQMLRQYEKAAEAFDKALNIEPDLFDAMFNKGMALALANKPKKAEKALRAFIRAASSRKKMPQEYIRAAQDKISEMYGTESTTSTLPKRRKR